MKSTKIIPVGILGLIFFIFPWISQANAQEQDGWSEPYRLSSDQGRASEGYPVADQYGYVHVLWSEALFEHDSSLIQYARFDGETWTNPVDIYVTDPFFRIEKLSPFIDQHGVLHLAWTEGRQGPVYYAYAPAVSAFSAQNWSQPLRIDVSAQLIELLVDSQDVLHILYSKVVGQDMGVYYSRSQDRGLTWSQGIWLDPDNLPGFIIHSLEFELDDAGGLHAVWHYVHPETFEADWVRYAHSLDGGDTWSIPFTIDKQVEGSEHMLTHASPRMIVQGQNVHIIWAGGQRPFRHHRLSTDVGLTWSDPVRIFGNLLGQAFDGFARDGLGRIHFLSHIRYPEGIYHSIWHGDRWTQPSMIYFIAQSHLDPTSDRILAHYVYPTVRAGNQLLVTFTDSPGEPGRRLFAMHRNLEEVPELPTLAIPDPNSTVTPVPSPTSISPIISATVTQSAQSFSTLPNRLEDKFPDPSLAIWIGLVPALLIGGGVVIYYRFLIRCRP